MFSGVMTPTTSGNKQTKEKEEEVSRYIYEEKVDDDMA